MPILVLVLSGTYLVNCNRIQKILIKHGDMSTITLRQALGVLAKSSSCINMVAEYHKVSFAPPSMNVVSYKAEKYISQDFSSLRKILKEGWEYGVEGILSTQDLSHFKTGENNYDSYHSDLVVHRVTEIRDTDINVIFIKNRIN